MTDYKAKPEVWKGFENLYGVRNPFNPIHSEFVDAILELRARVDALEAGAAPPEPAPVGSLVERVAIACAKPCNETWDDQARAAIREVAAWLKDKGHEELSDWLCCEAER